MTDTELLLDLIEKRGIKKGAIAKHLGISPYCFSKKVNNVTEFKSSEIQKLCDFLCITTLSQKEQIFFAKQVDSQSTGKEI